MGKSLAHFVIGWGYCAYLLVHEKKNIIYNKLSLTANIWSLVLMRATFAKKILLFCNYPWGTLVQNNKHSCVS